MSDYETIMRALRNAHAAGDDEGARRLARMAISARGGIGEQIESTPVPPARPGTPTQQAPEASPRPPARPPLTAPLTSPRPRAAPGPDVAPTSPAQPRAPAAGAGPQVPAAEAPRTLPDLVGALVPPAPGALPAADTGPSIADMVAAMVGAPSNAATAPPRIPGLPEAAGAVAPPPVAPPAPPAPVAPPSRGDRRPPAAPAQPAPREETPRLRGDGRDRSVQMQAPAAPDPFAAETAGDLAARRGQEVAQGASAVIQSVARARGIDDRTLAASIEREAPGRVKEAARQADRFAEILARGIGDDGVSPMSAQERATYQARLDAAVQAVQQWADVAEFGPAFAGNRAGGADAAAESVRKWTDETFGVPPQDDSLWSQLAYGAGSMVAFVLPSALAGPAGTLVTAQMGSDAAKTEAYDRARQAGASDRDAQISAQIMGFLGSAEALPIASALNRLPAPVRANIIGRIGRFVSDTAKGSIEEAVQEAGIAIAQNIVARGIYDPDQAIITPDVGEQALVGAILGGLLGGGANVVGAGSRPSAVVEDQDRERRPDATVDFAPRRPQAVEGDPQDGTPPAAPAGPDVPPAPPAPPAAPTPPAPESTPSAPSPTPPAPAPAPQQPAAAADDDLIPVPDDDGNIIGYVRQDPSTGQLVPAQPANGDSAGAALPPPSAPDEGGAPAEVVERPETPAAPVIRRSPAPDAQDVAVTPTGRDVPVEYAVVELDDLIASNTDDGRVNPAYPAELQPRDRTRPASQQQVRDIAQNLDPRLLGRNPSATDGAPIIDPSGVVESGNGRIMALRQVYRQGGAQADRYRQELQRQRMPVDGYRQPVLVRVRQGEMAPEDRAAFTREANERTTAAMSATERAMADAQALPDNLLSLYRGGDVDAVGNRDFVRGFISAVVPESDRGGMIDGTGQMSQEAVRRVQAALLAKAYGDADLVAALVESADNDIKAIGGALTDVAATWAQMRAEARSGQIAPEMDQTAALLDAVRVVNRARQARRNVAEFVGQGDLLAGDTLSMEAQGFLGLFFRDNAQWTKPAGRDKIADALRFYVDEARKTAPGADLLGATADPQATLRTARDRQYGRPEQEQQPDLLTATAGGAGAGLRPAGGGQDAGSGRPAAVGGDGEEAAGSGPRPAGEGQDAEVVQRRRRLAAEMAVNRRMGGSPFAANKSPLRSPMDDDAARDFLVDMEAEPDAQKRRDMADDFVRRMGKKHGVEWMVLLDTDMRTLGVSVGRKDGVSFGSDQFKAIMAGRVAYGTHNHPRTTMFSAADVMALGLGIPEVAIMAHNGQRHVIRNRTIKQIGNRDALISAARAKFDTLHGMFVPEVNALIYANHAPIMDGETFSQDAADTVNTGLFTLALHRHGLVDYEGPARDILDGLEIDTDATLARNDAAFAAGARRIGNPVAEVRGGGGNPRAGGDPEPGQPDQGGTGLSPVASPEPQGVRPDPETVTPPDDFDADFDAALGAIRAGQGGGQAAVTVEAISRETWRRLQGALGSIGVRVANGWSILDDRAVGGSWIAVSRSRLARGFPTDVAARDWALQNDPDGGQAAAVPWADATVGDMVRQGEYVARRRGRPKKAVQEMARALGGRVFQDGTSAWAVITDRPITQAESDAAWAAAVDATRQNDPGAAPATPRAPKPRDPKDIAKDIDDILGGMEEDAVAFKAPVYERLRPLLVEAARAAAAEGATTQREQLTGMMRSLVQSGVLSPERIEQLRPYFRRFREDVESGAITLEAEDVPGSGGPVEPDSGDADPENDVGAAGVPAAAGADGQGARPRARPAAEGGDRPAGGAGVPDGDAAGVGGSGDPAVRGGARLAPGAAPDRDGAGGDDGRGPRLPDDAGPDQGAVRPGPRTADGLTRRERQDAADKIPVKVADLANIEKTLPNLLPEQQDDVLRIEQRFAKPDAHGMLITNGTGTGKAQPLDAGILTPTGWRRMGDIAQGDRVIAADGSPTEVVAVYPQGIKPIYRVEFSDGAATECCDDHLWETQTLYERRKSRENPDWECAKPKVRALSEIRETLAAQHFVPLPAAIEHDSEDLPIPAYTMGVILGDGCLRGGSITVANPDQEIADAVSAEIPAGFSLREVGVSEGRCRTWRISDDTRDAFGPHRMMDGLRRLGLMGAKSEGKFIPPEYLRGSVADRVALLQGLMDTDGTVDRRTGSVSFCTVSDILAFDVIALVRSLGGICTRSTARKHYTSNGERHEAQPAHILTLTLPNSIAPFRLPRKAQMVRPKQHPPRRKIVSVTLVGKKPAQCIAVADHRRLYVTDDYILTHNTYTGGGVIKRFVRQGKGNILIIAPSDGILDAWVAMGRDMGVPISKLQSTKDAGQGVVVTTYANAGDNKALASRDFDLVVADEAHYLASAADGKPTLALHLVRALTLRSKVDMRRLSHMRRAPEWEAFRAMAKADPRRDGEFARLRAQEEADVEALAKRARPKMLFMSATPFAWDKNVDYAEGYLFSYGAGGTTESGSRQDGRAFFFVQNFGYRIRYHKLTKPEDAVDSAVFEREFHERLKREGALWGRSLTVSADYDRRFVRKEDAEGAQIDEAMEWVRQNSGNDSDLGRDVSAYAQFLRRSFQHHKQMQLLEAIKAKHALPDIRAHLALGRKVIVFHDFKQGGGFNPFMDTSRVVPDEAAMNGYRHMVEALPWVQTLNFSRLTSPIETMRREFGAEAVFYNGDVSKKDRAEAIRSFNTDNGGAKVFVVIGEAGKEGISLHDTTGAHQRVIINLGMPARPTTTLQEEGRARRVGSVSDAIFRYYTIGTTWERRAFASKIAERSGTVENLALGNAARTIRDSFVDAYFEAGDYTPAEGEGKGGVERDSRAQAASPFDVAKTHYFGRMKQTARRDQRKGIDFYPTPEPLGFKMVEWARMRPNERALEPSVGDGAISRYFPEHVDTTIVDPSQDLLTTAHLRTPGARTVGGTFETLHVTNKFDAIVMNPPFGSGGATAFQHVRKAMAHTRPGGRIVALVPTGPAADRQWEKIRDESDLMREWNWTADVALPEVTFERAGTAVRARVLILDRVMDPDRMTHTQRINLTGPSKIEDFFDRLEGIAGPERIVPPVEPAPELDAAPQTGAPLAAGGAKAFDLSDFRNTKTGEPVFVATAKARTSRDEYEAMIAVAKRHGGWWNRYANKAAGAVKGYGFPSAEARAAFLDDMAKPTQGMEESTLTYDGTVPPAEAPVFYSAALRGVVAAKQKQAPAKDWKAILGKAPGVKKAELDWLGVNDWLDAQEGQVTREALANFIRANQIEIVETVGGEADPVSYAIDIGDAIEPDWEYDAEFYMDEAREELADEMEDGEEPDEADVRDRAEQIARERFRASVFRATLYDANNIGRDYEGIWDDDERTFSFPDIGDFGNRRDAERAAEDAHAPGGADFEANFESYTEGGGDNYREILLRVPRLHETGANRVRKDKAAAARIKALQAEADAMFAGGRRPADLSAAELARRNEIWAEISSVERAEAARMDAQIKEPFVQSAHFAAENVVVHARVKDRRGPNGERVLFVEEIQSDLGSVWRENQEDPAVTARRRELQAERDALDEERRVIQQRAIPIMWEYMQENAKPQQRSIAPVDAFRELFKDMRAFDNETVSSTPAKFGAAALRERDGEVYDQMLDIARRTRANHRDLIALGTEKRIPPGTPATPFLGPDTYALMAKRLVRMAADGGYDRLQWTPGYMQAERWNAAAQSVVEGVRWGADALDLDGEPSGPGKMVALDMGANDTMAFMVNDAGVIVRSLHRADGAVDKPLSSLIGPGLARQIMEAPSGSVSGQKITFPDSGYAIAYDQQTRQAVERIAKGTGAKVTQTRDMPDFQTDMTGPSDPVWNIDITDALREKAKGGFSVLQAPRGSARPVDPQALQMILPALRAELDRLDLKRVRLEVDRPGARHQGQFRVSGTGDMAIVIGASLNPWNTLYHEVIHALRAQNLFTPRENEALDRAARKWIDKHDIRTRYPDLSPSEQIEEAIAEEFAARATERKAPAEGSAIVNAFNKIARFFRALRSALTGAGFNTAEDIFGRVLAGQLRARNAGNTGVVATMRWMDAQEQRAPAGLEEPDIQFGQPPRRRRRAAPVGPHIPHRGVWDELTAANVSVFGRLDGALGAIHDRVDVARIYIQDRMLPVLRAQASIEEAIGQPLGDEHNAYQTEEGYASKVGKRLFDIDEKYTKPIISIIAGTEGGLTSEDVGLFLTARHAKERNAQIRSINPNMPDGGSGMTDARADAILAAAAASPHAQAFEDIAALIYRMRDETLDLRLESGLLSADEHALWKSQYRFYVPLKGFADTDHSEATLDLQGIGRRYNVRGRESQQALGRSSLAFNPLVAAITQAQEVAVRAEKNRVAQAMYRLARDNPAPELWAVRKPAQKRFYNRSTGLVETRLVDPASEALKPNEFAVKVDGKEHRIEVRDWRLEVSLGAMGSQTVDGVTKTFGMYSRLQSSVNTMLNPVFTVVNGFRDATAALINIPEMTNEPGFGRAVMRNWANALAGAHRGLGGDYSGEWGQHFEAFQKAGGQISFWTLENPAAGLTDIERRIDLARGSRARRALKIATTPAALFSTRDNPILGGIERANIAVDNAVRLAAFVEARKRGWSEAKAASLAKNLTVNFNRRGIAGTYLNSYFVFANAAIQGTQVFLRVMTSPRMVKFLVGSIGFGLIMEMMNAALSDEDDDGELAYDKIPDHRLQRFLMLPNVAQLATQGASDDWFSIPLPYTYSLLPYAGTQIGKVMRGKKEPGEALRSMFLAIVSDVSPTSPSSFFHAVTPTLIADASEFATNSDWLGRPIRPENPFADYGPMAYKYYAGASELSKTLADAANRATGGSASRPGFIDVSPEYIDHLFGTVTGAAGRFFGNTTDLVVKGLTGQWESIDPRSVPFYSQLVTETGQWYDRNAFYDRSRRVAEARDAVRRANEARETPDYADVRLERLHSEANRIKRQIATARQRIEVINADRSLSPRERQNRVLQIEQAMQTAYDRFNRAFLREMKAIRARQSP